jgi:hypothetical protein
MLKQSGLSIDGQTTLVSHAQKLKDASLAYKTKLTKLPVEELAAEQARMEGVVPLFEGLLSQYDSVVEGKGEQAAGAELNDSVKKMLADPSVAGNLPPNMLKVLQSADVTPQTLKAMLAGSNYHKDFITNNLNEQRAKLLEEGPMKGATNLVDNNGVQYINIPGRGVFDMNGTAFTGDVKTLTQVVPPNKSAGSTGNEESYTSISTGENFSRNTKNNDVFKLNADGTKTLMPGGLPADVVRSGTAAAAKAKSTEDAKQFALTPDENDYIANFTSTYGKPIPGIPAGAGNTPARMQYLKAFAKLGMERGYDGSEAGLLALQRDSSKEALKSLIKQDTIIKAGEKDLENVFQVLRDEIKKAGGPDSPLLRKYYNKALTEWIGDPALSGVNAAYANFVETAARVFSGQSGAGGTPVAYLALAEKSIGKNPNLEQIVKLEDTMTKLFDARRKSVEFAQSDLIGKLALKPKPGSPAAAKDAAPAPDSAPAPDAAPAPDSAMFAGDPAAARVALKKLRDDVKAGISDKAVYDREAPALEAAITKGEAKIAAAFGKYEPDVYLYRIKPDGTVQRKKK